jgi:YggT family protein
MRINGYIKTSGCAAGVACLCARVKSDAAERVAWGIALRAPCGYLWRNLQAERPMTSIYQILMLLLDVAQFILIAHIIMSWLINFQVLNLRQPLVASIWDGLQRLLEPIYSRVRAVLPNMGGLDLAPLVVILGIIALRIVLTNNAAAFL